ncbi:response regulator transcription factor [Acidaminobacter sp. JC074]|uniref:response regulator transcription factor n=1 Tax=Acidaminobacter sp. JC074 TaxID=2530199 RepID=UPI001F0E6E91|nr:response regulator transcription factor [Acidaminobacter sp. JC074]
MKVLILETDKKLADRIHGYVKNLNYEVCIERSAEAFTSYIDSQAYDGLIINLDNDSHKILSHIMKIRNAGSRIPILVYGYFFTDLIIDQCHKFQYCDFIKRPFSKAEFLFRVNALFTRHNLKASRDTAKSECIKLNGCSFYPESYKIWTDDQIVNLTRREAELLKILAFNIKNVVSKGQILDAIWANQENVDENLVAVYISKLRKLFLENKIEIRIDTVKNVGYSLIS